MLCPHHINESALQKAVGVRSRRCLISPAKAIRARRALLHHLPLPRCRRSGGRRGVDSSEVGVRWEPQFIIVGRKQQPPDMSDRTSKD